MILVAVLLAACLGALPSHGAPHGDVVAIVSPSYARTALAGDHAE